MYRLLVLAALLTVCAGTAGAAEEPAAAKYLYEARLAEGENDLAAALAKAPRDDQLRFGLGALRFVRAAENLGRSLYRHGLRVERGARMMVPVVRLPLPQNPKPEKLTYAGSREILKRFLNDLRAAEATLAAVRAEDVKLPLRVGAVHLDIDGDGKPDTRFAHLLGTALGGREIPATADLAVTFDRADVAWLRGYCHLLTAFAEAALAHDGKELFDHTAHIFFANPDTPYAFLLEERKAPFFDVGDGLDLIDVIAFIHTLRLPVAEPERMKSALGHLEKMLALSRESWKYIQAEKDDDNEWIPNPQQKGALGIPVRREMIDGWMAFVGEAEALLAGKRLVPFWRGAGDRGVNLRRVFTEPRTLDAVLWVQGTAAAPYLEEGEMSRKEVWDQLLRVFRGEFLGFALWFN